LIQHPACSMISVPTSVSSYAYCMVNPYRI
jgi:hypothetical protein